MDIDKVIELIREAKKKSSKCPPGFKYIKKKKDRTRTRVRKESNWCKRIFGGYRGGDNRSDSGNGQWKW